MKVEQPVQHSEDKQCYASFPRLRSVVGKANAIGLFFVGAMVVAISLWASPGLVGALGAALGVIVVSIAAIDVRRYIIPDSLNLAALILGLVYAATTDSDQVLSALFLALVRGAVMAFAFFGLRFGYLYVRGCIGIGLGDVKLAAVAGVWIDWSLLGPGVGLAAASGLCAYLIRQHVLGRPIVPGSRLPFGAFLAPMIWVCWFTEQIVLAPGN
jgi:leader peptidase (prepilin peptidase)/N-methyltransferase